MASFLYIIFGLIIGSFLNVCIYRIPRSERYFVEEETPEDEVDSNLAPESTREPLEAPIKPIGFFEPKRSICPKCEAQLNWWNNIPLISWIFQKGRCSFCREAISARYPFVELLTGFFSLLTFSTFGFTITGLLIFCYIAAFIVITFIDYDFYIIPNVISIPGIAIGIGISLINNIKYLFDSPFNHTLLDCFYGVLAGGGSLWFISEVYLKLRKKEGLGFGDVKLLAMVGAAFGPECAIITIFIGSLVGSVFGFGMILWKKQSYAHHIPFGPFLVVGTIFYLFWNQNLFIDPNPFMP